MYRIKGADQKEYGPITAEQVRQWITENRLNQSSLAAGEDGVWKSLGQFPEFAALFPVAAPNGGYGLPAGPTAEGAERARATLKAPAILLIIFGVLGILGGLAQAGMSFAGIDPGRAMFKAVGIKIPEPPPGQEQIQHTIQVVTAITTLALGIPYNVVMIVGALRMMALRKLGLAKTSAILAIIPCFSVCCLITMPLGIWAIILLGKPEVANQFTKD